MTDLTQKLESSLSFARELNALKEQNKRLREALELADGVLGFHEGSAKQQVRDGVPYGHPVIWINGEDHASVLTAIRAALAKKVPA